MENSITLNFPLKNTRWIWHICFPGEQLKAPWASCLYGLQNLGKSNNECIFILFYEQVCKQRRYQWCQFRRWKEGYIWV